MNLYEKLQQVQSKLKAPKNQYNKFGGYHYRNCEDIQEAVKPLLQEVKAALVVGDELVLIGERYYIRAAAKFIDCESGEYIENVAYAREELDKKGMDVSQVTGSTSSYARKYALNSLFCIDDVKDADNQDNSDDKKSGSRNSSAKGSKAQEKSAPTGSGEKVTGAMISSITAQVERYREKGVKMEKILGMYSIKDISEMTLDQYRDCMNKLKLYEKGDQK